MMTYEKIKAYMRRQSHNMINKAHFEYTYDHIKSWETKYNTGLGECITLLYNQNNTFSYASKNAAKISFASAVEWMNFGPKVHFDSLNAFDHKVFAFRMYDTIKYLFDTGKDSITFNVETKIGSRYNKGKWVLLQVPLICNNHGLFTFTITTMTETTHLKSDAFQKAYWVDNDTGKIIYDAYDITSDIYNYGISKREIEIINLLADGKSNEEIADTLFISRDTVKTHRKNILKKLPVKNSLHMIKFACQHGFIKDDKIRSIALKGISKL